MMDENHIPINDLYNFALARLSTIQRPANVHFTPEGYAALAERAAASIRAVLEASAYLKAVRSYADAMIEHGHDVYGEVHSPPFAAALDRETLKLPGETPPPYTRHPKERSDADRRQPDARSEFVPGIVWAER